MEYELAGKSKHTILLEAGGFAGLSDWEPVFESLIQHAKVIRYSRIGNGGSAQIKKIIAQKNMQLRLCYFFKY